MIRYNKLLNFVERIEGSRRPITADVFLTNFCNNKCIYCTRYSHRNGEYMRLADFVDYAHRLINMGVKGFILTGGGEPTISPDFNKITDWLEKNNIQYGINTNLNKPIFCNPNFLKVSIDSGNPIQYAKIRGKDSLGAVINNLKNIIEYTKNNNKTKVGVQCIATSREQAESFYVLVKDIDVAYIQFRPVETTSDNYDYSQILEYINSLDDDRIVRSFKYELLHYEPKYCFGNWSVITIDVNGNVPYCCHKPDDIVGHITDVDILQKLQEHKTDMSTCERPCRLSGVNKFLDGYKLENDQFFV